MNIEQVMEKIKAAEDNIAAILSQLTAALPGTNVPCILLFRRENNTYEVIIKLHIGDQP